MAEVNTKLQDFYNKGRRDAVNDCDNFLRMVADKYGYLQVENGVSLQQFLEIVAQQMSKNLGGSQR